MLKKLTAKKGTLKLEALSRVKGCGPTTTTSTDDATCGSKCAVNCGTKAGMTGKLFSCQREYN